MTVSKKTGSLRFKSPDEILQDIVEGKLDTRYPVPKSVLILGRQVPVFVKEKFKDDGEFDHHKVLINLRANMAPIEEMDTLLHETLHAIDHWLDLGLTERQIRLMATALIGVFQDDQEFSEFVTRPMKVIE